MTDPREPNTTDLPASWAQASGGVYELCLYVAGATPLSARAIVNIRRICETHLAGRYELEIVDISRSPRRLSADQITATPTLLRRKPLPARRFIGDLSATERVLEGLDLIDRTRPLS